MSQTITLYSFTELSENAQKTALDHMRYVAVEGSNWYLDDYEYFKEELAKVGYEVKDIHFSGFSSQGDGACFTGAVDVLKWLEATGPIDAKTRSLYFWLKKLGSAAAYVTIGQQGRYYHKYTMTIDLEWAEWPEPPKAGEQLRELESAILDHARDQAEKIYRGLEKTHDALTDDDCVKERLTINNVMFYETGEFVARNKYSN